MLHSLFTLRLTAGAFCAAVSLLLAPAADAQTQFTIAFAPQTQVLTPGMTETFSATITNSTTADLYINQSEFGSFPSGLIFDDALFYNTFGGTLLGAGKTTALTSLFTVTDVNAAPGTYIQNPYTVAGGTTANATDRYGNSTFDVVVSNSSAPVPEASTSLLLGLLLAAGALAFTAQRRRRTAAL